MTWPMTLTVSKPHDYKQNVQKMKGFLKKRALTGNSLKISNQKNQKLQSSYGEQNKRTTRPRRQKLNMKHLATKKLTEAKLKKAFRINDAGRATTCRRNFKAPWLQTERTKSEGPSERMICNLETNWMFQTKKFKNCTPPVEKKTREPQVPEGRNWTRAHASRRK